MSYIPTQWNTGDIVTAEKLNKIEGAIEECSSNTSSVSGLVEASMDIDTEVWTINKSFNDLVAITQAGILPFCTTSDSSETYYGILIGLLHTGDTYMAQFQSNEVIVFISSDPDSLMTTATEDHPGSPAL